MKNAEFRNLKLRWTMARGTFTLTSRKKKLLNFKKEEATKLHSGKIHM